MELQGLLREIAEKGVLYPNTEAIQMMDEVSNEARELCMKLNTGVYTDEEIRQQMSQIIGQELDENFSLFLPFTTDFGKNIRIGKDAVINSGCRFQDQGGITIGDQSLIGHNVVLATINHDYDPDNRGILHLAPVVLKEKTWIGSNVTILPGVTVGENSVVAAGSVVTKDVAPNTIVGGNPAKLISHLEDKLK
ncbi:DapH/DapD/GlmU-related protein [Tetragenococcus muriaticus]|uniref:Maltose O-acetyltransferase n=2 Tax=Tetragenococcus muriaticus TaxID=64642 RepID=A0A091BTW4_9ENTE|nr:DapH/DapD/GlmU-related protein [Tetragenococcus muriaticus]KFN89106.1 maltose O-acetyltransferase [Tetragenococcus muriaticus 3MR10-3]KFN92485.1 maltose O-acetyltransferase [Tetragenococcus muriaticus PMC-11-5]GMA46522.1 acetyltransferase [Tetragenococcus muriaticus]